MIECHVRKRSGEYIWVEASLRVVRQAETGDPFKVLNIVRDITERKRAEQKLQEAYNALEALAVTDALTGLANRRRFDQCLASEWRRALRDRKPLSLLMIDADLFKSYNATYGHLRGDSCLISGRSPRQLWMWWPVQEIWWRDLAARSLPLSCPIPPARALSG